MIGIYKIRNTTTNMVYFGQSQDIEERIKYHFSALQKGNHHNYLLQNAFNMGELMEWEVVEEVDINNLNDRERVYLSIAERYPDFYYNLAYYPEAVRRGCKLSVETRAKISAAKKGRKLGPPSAEHRAKMSEAKKGRKYSVEHCASVSAALKGRKLSAEHCAKMSAAQIEYWRNKNANK